VNARCSYSCLWKPGEASSWSQEKPGFQSTNQFLLSLALRGVYSTRQLLTAADEKYDPGKAEILEVFLISLFSGNGKESGSHEYSTWLVFYLLGFIIRCVCSLLSLWVLGFW